MHTLNSSVDTFATKSIDENNQMKAAMRALASPGFEGQGETQNILSNYNLEDSVDEKDVSFKTDEGDDEGKVGHRQRQCHGHARQHRADQAAAHVGRGLRPRAAAAALIRLFPARLDWRPLRGKSAP